MSRQFGSEKFWFVVGQSLYGGCLAACLTIFGVLFMLGEL